MSEADKRKQFWNHKIHPITGFKSGAKYTGAEIQEKYRKKKKAKQQKQEQDEV